MTRTYADELYSYTSESSTPNDTSALDDDDSYMMDYEGPRSFALAVPESVRISSTGAIARWSSSCNPRDLIGETCMSLATVASCGTVACSEETPSVEWSKATIRVYRGLIFTVDGAYHLSKCKQCSVPKTVTRDAALSDSARIADALESLVSADALQTSSPLRTYDEAVFEHLQTFIESSIRGFNAHIQMHPQPSEQDCEQPTDAEA
jgi:hypothetical protein